MADYDFNKDPEVRAAMEAERERLAQLDDIPPPVSPDDYGAQPLDDAPAPLRPALHVVEGGGIPAPRSLPSSLLPVASFDMGLMPERLRPWASDLAERMQCPPDYIGVSLMVCAAAVIGRKIAVRPMAQDDWTVIGIRSGEISPTKITLRLRRTPVERVETLKYFVGYPPRLRVRRAMNHASAVGDGSDRSRAAI